MIDAQKLKDSAATIKDLSRGAEQFITELYGDLSQFQIEEVSKAADGANWLVTVSYYQRHESPNDLQKYLGLLGVRVFKQLAIKPDGTVISVKNWFPERAAA